MGQVAVTERLRAAYSMIGWSLHSFGLCVLGSKYFASGAAKNPLKELLAGVIIVGEAGNWIEGIL